MYKMIALDLDGTLNNDEKKITEKTREALLSVQQHGVTVVLASGRQAPGLARDRWGFHGWAGFDEDAWADLLDEWKKKTADGMKPVLG